MLKGTRIIEGEDVIEYNLLINTYREYLIEQGFNEVIVPQIWESSTFFNKISNETKDQIWTFKDKGDRDVCLIPEVTGIIQEIYDSTWSKSKSKPIKIFYVSRCYRYEKPQLGRYREFTQFGIEILGHNDHMIDKKEAINTLLWCLGFSNISFKFSEGVKRGLGYYVEDGFEAICEDLGAQKQVAGGGRYKQGIGWAIGIDRVLLAQKT